MSRDTLTVLALSDLHGLPVPELDGLGAGRGDVVLVDNGDLYGGLSDLAFRAAPAPGACATLQWLGGLGTAAGNLGNHDLDGGIEALQRRAAQGDVDLLSGNLAVDGAPLLPGRRVHDTPVGPVGIAAALTPVAWDLWTPAVRARTAVTDPVESLVRDCRALRPHCHWVVALAHFGMALPPLDPSRPPVQQENPGEALLQQLARRSAEDGGRPLADVVVLGHTHVAQVFLRDATAVVNPGARGQAVAEVCLDAGEAAAVAAPPRVRLVPCPGEPERRLASCKGPGADRLRQQQRRLQGWAAQPLKVAAGARTFGEQILAVARGALGADGLLLTTRLGLSDPPVTTVGALVQRSPLLEPLVLLELDRDALAAVRRLRQWHEARAAEQPDPRLARRHAWHAFAMLGSQDRPRQRWLVPAAWAGGYGGYDALRQAPKVAEPGLSLVELLLRGSAA